MVAKKILPKVGCLLAIIVFSFVVALLLYWIRT